MAEEKKIELTRELVIKLMTDIALAVPSKEWPAAHLDVRLRALVEYARLKGFYASKEKSDTT